MTIHDAARTGDIPALRRLLDGGADPNAGKSKHDKPLGIACAAGRWEAAVLLLEQGAKPAPREAVWQTIRKGRADVVRAMLAAGLDPHARGGVGDTHLHDAVFRAAEADDVGCLDAMLEAGADVAKAEAGRESIAWPAVAHGKPHLLRRLVSLGASVDHPLNDQGKTSLMWLADVTRGDRLEEETAALFRLLVKLRADLNRRDEDGRTALDYATNLKNNAAARLLRELGGEPGASKEDDEASGRDPLEDAPFAQRRGTVKVWDYNDWTAAVVDLGDARPAGAERVDVADLLAGKLDYPAARFVLLVKLAGHRWTLAAPSWSEGIGGYDFGKWLSKQTGRPVLQVGHNDTASATFLSLHDAAEEKVYFESCGEEYHAEDDEDMEDVEFPTSFRSDRHPADWWNGHDDENAAVQALLRDLDAYVPLLYAADEGGKLKPQAYPDDALEPANVEWAALVHPQGRKATKKGSAAAAKALEEAIKQNDPTAVTAAVAAGADLNMLPGGRTNPLAWAVRLASMSRDQKREKAISVIRSLLAAGADPNGSAAGSPLTAAADGSSFTPAGPIEVARLLLDAGADVNHLAPHPLYKRSSTALHVAAFGDNTAMLRFLLERGADPTVADGQGQTPRQALQATVVNARESGMLDDEDLDQMVQGQAEAVRLLEEAERGALLGDWRPAAEAAEAKSAVLRSQLAAAFEGLKQAFTADAVDAVDATVKLEPAARARWADAAARDALAGPLRAAGFKTRVGVFRLSIAAGEVLVLALLDRRRNAYAAVYEHAGRHWADLVRWHGDGSMLTVTNAPTIPAAEADLSAFRKVRLKSADAAALVAALDAEAPPADVVKLTPDAFAARFETAYAEETAARRAGA